MLVLKLTLAPGLIALATLAARRWGPAAAGWMASLPVVSGPILLVVTLQHGTAFGSSTAASATAGLLSLAVFTTVYALLARSGLAWGVALLGGWLAFASSTWLLWLVAVPRGAAVLVVLGVAVGGRALLGPSRDTPRSGRRLPGDIVVRMVAGALLVLAVTAASAALGPRLTGLLAPFPVIASVLAAFTHFVDGPTAVQRYAHALLRGLPSFVLFTLTASLAVVPLGTAGGFLVATAVALASHAGLIVGGQRVQPAGAG